jgi:hypothetical protein
MSINSLLQLFTSFIPGSRLVDGGDCLALAKLSVGATNGLTAHAGGGQTNATALPMLGCIEVDTVATGADSVMLPQALPGTQIELNNATATSMQVFGQTINQYTGVGDTIAAAGSSTQQPTATGVAHAGNTCFTYVCFVAGSWKQR